jgi:hypothetical protein
MKKNKKNQKKKPPARKEIEMIKETLRERKKEG